VSDNEHIGGSSKRRRLYPRRFSYVEARARAKAGETVASIARAFGVDRRTIRRALHLSEAQAREASPEQVAAAGAMPRDRVPCPRCERPKVPEAELCRDCRNELRLESPVTVRKIPGTAGRSTVELRDVDAHRIVSVDGRYGVALGGASVPSMRGYRAVDFWDSGLEFVNNRSRVQILPATEVLVGGEPELPEEIS